MSARALRRLFWWGYDGPDGAGAFELSRYPLSGAWAPGAAVPQRQKLPLPSGLAEQLSKITADDDALYAVRTYRQLVPGESDVDVSQVLRIPSARWD